MFVVKVFAFLILFAVLMRPITGETMDWYIATNGTPAGPGSLHQPFDLTTALYGIVGQPGDRFWLGGGNYAIGHINTKIQGAAGAPISFCPLPGEHAKITGSITFFNSAGYVNLKDLEICGSDTNRLSSQTNAGLSPTDLNLLSGLATFCPNMNFVNLVIHDETGEGIYVSQISSNTLIYGCIIYNNGWCSPDNAEGHGIYMQGWNGAREISDNIVFNNSGADLHVYEDQANYSIADITLDGNTAFNGGAIQNVRAYRDWIVGVDAPAINADQIVFENNMGYLPIFPTQDDLVQIGRQGVNGAVAILNNYLPTGIELNNWKIAAVSGNSISAQITSYAVALNQSLTTLSAVWNNNIYVVPPSSPGFLTGTNIVDFLIWQVVDGYDLTSIYESGNPSGTQVFVRTNHFDPEQASITVYNWNNLSNVEVNVTNVLSLGTPFEVLNAEDLSAPPVLSSVYNGQSLNLPMTGLTVAVPNGPMNTPPPTGPTFNVFLLLPRSIKLQGTAANGSIQLNWTTNSGNWTLQSTTNVLDNSWTDITNTPAIVGSQNVVTNTILEFAEFFRLQPAP